MKQHWDFNTITLQISTPRCTNIYVKLKENESKAQAGKISVHRHLCKDSYLNK